MNSKAPYKMRIHCLKKVFGKNKMNTTCRMDQSLRPIQSTKRHQCEYFKLIQVGKLVIPSFVQGNIRIHQLTSH